MDASATTEEGSLLRGDRRRAALYTLPFFLIGTLNVVLILWWGLEAVWLFAMLPPVIFMTGLTWIAFETDMLKGR